MVRNGVIETPSLSNRLRVLPLYEFRIPDGASFRSRTEFTALQVRHIAGNAYEARKCGALAGNLTRVSSLPGLTHRKCVLPLNYEGWSFAADLNRARWYTRPVRRHLRLRSMERDAVIETAPQPWQGCILPLNQSRDWSGRPITIRRLLFGRPLWKRMALPLSYARVNCYGVVKEQTTKWSRR